MSVSATQVRELREKTNAGMLDCKKALEETQGNFEAAVEWLRKKGLASAAKKADRLASEGMVAAYVSGGKQGAVIEVNSETDFVAKNELFRTFVKDLAAHISTSSLLSVEALLDSTMKGAKIGETLKEYIAKIGENLVVRRFDKVETSGFVHSYIHGDGKIGVLVELTTSKNDEAVKNFANDVCLHVAAMNPISLSPDQVPTELVEKEKEILKAKNLEQGKKPEMIEKIVEGQIRKFLAESCLLEQAFVKNPDQKVKDYLAETGKKVGEAFAIKRFVRYELGEGLAKKTNNFAEEVAAQTRGH
ncbi:MAG: translation elongation factor Ts [Pseudobdellovibrionaceae bacterium]|jgi:elongation factor Ts